VVDDCTFYTASIHAMGTGIVPVAVVTIVVNFIGKTILVNCTNRTFRLTIATTDTFVCDFTRHNDLPEIINGINVIKN
jgi:hypothetical protein